MKKALIGIILICTMLDFGIASGQDQKISFELDSNKTATYSEVVQFYQNLDRQYPEAKLWEAGLTDSGKPLQVLVLSKDRHFTPESARQAGKHILLINNGIHAGEPEGIDASMMLARDLLKSGNWHRDLVICIIPVYNIGGMQNRGTSRANQNGPDAYGTRGNARNYDLNRDFIKTDTRNSASFQKIFNFWDPDIFMDTHTSNGADYQYVMTLIETQTDKLHEKLQKPAQELTRQLYNQMEKANYGMVPYVTFLGQKPESGLVSFLENPRYSTGYAAVKHTIGYMPETHMWKPYWQRVRSTYTLLEALVETAGVQGKEIAAIRRAIKQDIQNQEEFVLNWALDTTKYEIINFKGYEQGMKPSEIHAKDRMYYDRNKPFERPIRHYNRYYPTTIVKKPLAYLIPQAWHRVIELLKLNGVEMTQLQNDQNIEMDMYFIDSYQTSKVPYEGHFIHSKVKTRTEKQIVACFAGDYLIHTNQEQIRYIVETLEPESSDSFFSWNFFDSILAKKNHYSAYIFEDYAYNFLQNNPSLKAEFEQAVDNDENLKNDPAKHLDWIYAKTPFYENTFQRYPIGRILDSKLPN